MLTLTEGIKIYLYSEPVDMRKGVNSLTILLVDQLSVKPQSGDLYLFRNRRSTKVKVLHWDKNGFLLHYKCIERGRFKFPRDLDGQIELSESQLSWLLAGLDFMLMAECKELDFSHYY